MNRGSLVRAAFASLLLACTALARTWTDTQGNTTKAEFVRVVGENVILSRAGRVLTVPFANLCAEDQQYIRQELEKKGKGDLVPRVTSLPAAAEGAALVAPAGAGPDSLGEMRTWTDIQGRTIEARFAGVSGQNVLLVKDGQQLSFPLSVFSPADQQYIQRQLQARAQGQFAPGQAGGAAMPGSGPGQVPPAGGEPTYPAGSEPRETSTGKQPLWTSPEATASQPGPSSTDTGSSPAYPGNSAGHPGGSQESSADTSGGPGMYPPGYSPPPPAPDTPPMPAYSNSGPVFEQVVVYTCSKCGHQLGADFKAGSYCPNCHAYIAYTEEPDGTRKYAGAGPIAGHVALRIGVFAVIAVVIGFIVKVVRGG